MPIKFRITTVLYSWASWLFVGMHFGLLSKSGFGWGMHLTFLLNVLTIDDVPYPNIVGMAIKFRKTTVCIVEPFDYSSGRILFFLRSQFSGEVLIIHRDAFCFLTKSVFWRVSFFLRSQFSGEVTLPKTDFVKKQNASRWITSPENWLRKKHKMRPDAITKRPTSPENLPRKKNEMRPDE